MDGPGRLNDEKYTSGHSQNNIASFDPKCMLQGKQRTLREEPLLVCTFNQCLAINQWYFREVMF
jgi:hypothetical protein